MEGWVQTVFGISCVISIIVNVGVLIALGGGLRVAAVRRDVVALEHHLRGRIPANEYSWYAGLVGCRART